MPKLKKGDIVEMIKDWTRFGRPLGSKVKVLGIVGNNVHLPPTQNHGGVYSFDYVKLAKTNLEEFYEKF